MAILMKIKDYKKLPAQSTDKLYSLFGQSMSDFKKRKTE